jgi:hypothetical protein
MKKFLILPASAKSVYSLTKTGFLILFLTQLSFSQIKIEERVEVNPILRIIPYGGVYSVDSTTCNKFLEDKEIKIRKGVDTTINVLMYGTEIVLIHFLEVSVSILIFSAVGT